MKRRLLIAFVLACVAVPTPAATSWASPRVPKGFFGVAPQTALTAEDARYMKAGGIDSVRWPLVWSAIQPTRRGGYNWSSLDETFAVAARAGLQILPVLSGTPRWLAKRETKLPVSNARQRAAWRAFLRATARRYGPGGAFWREHAQPGVRPTISRPAPIREWQIWNESNFFYFTYPVSPRRYAKLVTISSKAIRQVSPRAKIILAGLFGEPETRRPWGMDATTFLDRFYRMPGIRSRFDGVALHPYAFNTSNFARLVEAFHNVVRKNHDRVGLYITEMGWGSENDFEQVAFEQGIRGQVRQLRAAYRYLIANQRRLNLRQVYWFSWKDIQSDTCSFCNSVGLFREGERFKPKPAWHAFVRIAGGRPRP
jgi:hypothetical protein